MKKLALILTVLSISLFSYQNANAQKNEVNVSYGSVTSNSFSEFLSESMLEGITGGLYSFKDFKSTGAINVDYYYALSKRFKVGASVNYENTSREIYLGKAHQGKTESNHITIMPQVKYLYIANPSFELYSGLGFGASLRNEKYKSITNVNDKANDVFMAFQANLIGIRVGKKIGGFAEFGFGAKGLVNMGLSYKF